MYVLYLLLQPCDLLAMAVIFVMDVILALAVLIYNGEEKTEGSLFGRKNRIVPNMCNYVSLKMQNTHFSLEF